MAYQIQNGEGYSTAVPGPIASPDLPEGSRRDLIEQALHRAQVHDGFPDQRRALAVALDCAGVEPGDIDLLAASIRSQQRRDRDAAPVILATLLRDTKATRARVQDVRRGAALRAGAAPYPGSAQWQAPGTWPRGANPTPAEADAWRLADLRRKARALVLRDRRSPKEAAEALGVGVAEIVEWTRA